MPCGLFALHAYENPRDGCSMRARCGPASLDALHCCSSSSFSCAPVKVTVTRVLPNGCDSNASAVSHDAVAARCTQFGTQATRIGKRELSTLHTGRGKLGVGDQPTERVVAARARAPIETRHDPADRLLCQRGRQRSIVLDDGFDFVIGCQWRICSAQSLIGVGSVGHRQVARARTFANDRRRWRG